jgi:hypothetical protein
VSLLYIDGFAHQNNNRYIDYNGSYGINYATPGSNSRVSGGYYVTSTYYPGGMYFTKSIPARGEIFVGIGYRTGTSATSPSQQIAFLGDNNTTQHITIFCNATRKIEVRRGTSAGTVLATGTTDLGDSIWHYIEMHVTISDTVGTVQVRLDGQTTNEINFTGDTRNGGTSTNIDAVYFSVFAGSSGTSTALSDMYICDTSGTLNNSWLGDVAVRALVPNGNGTYTQLTNSSGTQSSNYTYVDELPSSGTDYVGSSTSGLADTYAMTDVPSGVATVYGMQVNAFVKKSDANLGQAKMRFRSGSTDFTGSTITAATSTQEFRQLRETNPLTGNQWTVSEVNGIEAGIEIA